MLGQPPIAVRLVLSGRVQGAGVRPAIVRLARHHGLGGDVQNTLDGLQIELEGAAESVAAFRRDLPDSLPAGITPDAVACEPLAPQGRREFTIEVAEHIEDDRSPLATHVPADVALCAVCVSEADDPGDRRHGYALIACAACGPRYTMLRAMPYERSNTTLHSFPLCPACEAEYRAPADRRFHAQSIACPRCGPNVWFSDGTVFSDNTMRDAERPLAAAVAVLRAGRILALAGIGGYQLLCDATRDDAVRRLRSRKGRPTKPLAVLVESLAAADRLAWLDADERAALASPANPIVLVRSRAGGLAESVAPGLPQVGLLLPGSWLHAALARALCVPLVCTSANREGEPLEYVTSQAESRLAGLADAWLHHDRPIARPIDDSVVQCLAADTSPPRRTGLPGRVQTLRLARGLAPLPLPIDATVPRLALGGQQKSAVAWSSGRLSALGPHVGDLETLESQSRWSAGLADVQSLYRFEPQSVACDAHPGYFTHRRAQLDFPAERVMLVPHHAAHVASLQVEHDMLGEPLLGVAWDGTGLGPDGNLWGGEFLLSDARSFERVAWFRPLELPGGERAVREPWRCAVAFVRQVAGADAARRLRFADVPPGQIDGVLALLDRGLHSPPTSSVGRLFDAVAALVLGVARGSYEGEAALYLEFAADETAPGAYTIALPEGSKRELDWRPLGRELLADLRRGVAPGTAAMRFHRALAAAITQVAACYPGLAVGLTGGVFQNRRLTELVLETLAPRRVLRHHLIPPNDGGLAAGQLAIASALPPPKRGN